MVERTPPALRVRLTAHHSNTSPPNQVPIRCLGIRANGCQDEPVTWSPAGAGIALDALPGPDPDALDPQRVHALLAQGMGLGRVAERLGTTLEHARYVIREFPPDEPYAPGSTRPAKSRLAARVTPDELSELIDTGHTIAAIGRRYGVTASTVRREVDVQGIAVPPTRRHAIDPGWLSEQYLVKQRTTQDICNETGASKTTIRRLFREHGIPVRPRGRQHLTAGEGYPQPLARALVGRGGVDRVRRFQVYASTPSLQIAAKRLGVYPNTLTGQLALLERVCGGALLEFTADQRRQGVTALGRLLREQADEHLAPHPDALPDLPEPLASSFAAFRGGEMLATLSAAARCKSLKEAALSLAVAPASLIRTICNVDRAVGEPVLIDYRRSAPLCLTPIGRRLLQQVEQHRDIVMPTLSSPGLS